MSDFRFGIILITVTTVLVISFGMFAYSYQPKQYCTAYEESISKPSTIKGITYGGYKYMKCVAFSSQKK